MTVTVVSRRAMVCKPPISTLEAVRELSKIAMWGSLHLIDDFLCILIILTDLIFSLQHGATKLRREGLGNLHRLADTRTFDDDILNFIQFCKTGKLGKQVTTESAADATVLKLNEFLLSLRDIVVSNQGGIDVKPM